MLHSEQRTIVKYGACTLVMIGFFLLQSTRGLAVHWRGVGSDIMPFLVASIALLEGPYAGGAFGFFAGTLLSVNSTGVEGFSSLYLSLFGILFGLFGSYYLREVALSALGGGALCTGLEALFRYLFHDYLIYGMSLLEGLERLGIQLALSLPVGWLAYLLLRRIHRRFTEDAT